ncbi:MAG: TatD family hydrolase [Bacteroidia bacterium]|nr:TatD family hydrolase [Bacteroidia bacterium]
MIFTDTHAHIYVEEFDSDFENCINRSIQNDVKRIFVPNIDETTINLLKNKCELYPEMCFPMIGLHPCSVKQNWEAQLKIIFDELISYKYYGIGEVGIDLYWDKSTFQIQKNVFIEQAKWAIKYNLPVSIHTREATEQVIEIIKSEKLFELSGVFHCFSGNEEQAKTVIEMGFYIGIGGTITYKKSTLPDLIKKIGIDKIVLETDSPYLPPEPYRGKRNETSYISVIAQKIANISEKSINEVALITTNNSKNIFGV